MFKKLLKTIRKDYLKLPWGVRLACFNLAILTFSWGLGTDTYLSIFTETLVQDLSWVGILLSGSLVIKLLLTIPIGELDSHVDKRKIIISGKIIYILSSFFLILAGEYQSISLLIIGFICFGIANPMVYTSYQCYLRQHSLKKNASQVFGLYNAEQAFAYCSAAIVTALIVPYFELHWFYGFVIIFALLSIFGDLGLPEKNGQPMWPEIKRLIWKKNAYIKISRHLKNYDQRFYFTLFLQFIWGLIDYITFIFVPLLAIQHELSLAQAALVFGFMRLPYILSFFFAEIADRRDSMALLGFSLVICGFLLGFLGYASGFIPILTIGIGISICLAMIRPTASGILTNIIAPRQRSEMTGVEQFLTMAGQIVGTLLFGFFGDMIGLNGTFFGLAIVVLLSGVITLDRRKIYDNYGRLEKINEPVDEYHLHPLKP